MNYCINFIEQHKENYRVAFQYVEGFSRTLITDSSTKRVPILWIALLAAKNYMGTYLDFYSDLKIFIQCAGSSVIFPVP